MSLVLSWGRYGGFYVTRGRICLGWVALTWLPMEIDDLMHMALHDVVEVMPGEPGAQGVLVTQHADHADGRVRLAAYFTDVPRLLDHIQTETPAATEVPNAERPTSPQEERNPSDTPEHTPSG